MLQWIQGFKYLFELVFLLISEKSSRVKFLHLMEVLSFNFLRTLPTVFHRGNTNLHSHQQCTKLPFSSYPSNTCYLLSYLITAILRRVKQYLILASFNLHPPEHHFLREGTGTPLQDSCLENPMDRGAW